MTLTSLLQHLSEYVRTPEWWVSGIISSYLWTGWLAWFRRWRMDRDFQRMELAKPPIQKRCLCRVSVGYHFPCGLDEAHLGPCEPFKGPIVVTIAECTVVKPEQQVESEKGMNEWLLLGSIPPSPPFEFPKSEGGDE